MNLEEVRWEICNKKVNARNASRGSSSHAFPADRLKILEEGGLTG